MAYENQDDSAAGDQLGASGDQSGSKQVTVPADLMPGCKAGDMYKVVSMDNDNVTLEMTGGGADDGDWEAGAKQAVAGADQMS